MQRRRKEARDEYELNQKLTKNGVLPLAMIKKTSDAAKEATGTNTGALQ